jgi:hypothetical protein
MGSDAGALGGWHAACMRPRSLLCAGHARRLPPCCIARAAGGASASAGAAASSTPLYALAHASRPAGERRQRAMQIWRWMYADDNWVAGLEQTLGLQNGFSQDFLDKIRCGGARAPAAQRCAARPLSRAAGRWSRGCVRRSPLTPPLTPSPPPPPLARGLASVDGGLELQQVARAADGTRKLVFRLTCGEGAGGSVETVLIPVVREQGKKPRVTVCVSSQVGGAWGPGGWAGRGHGGTACLHARACTSGSFGGGARGGRRALRDAAAQGSGPGGGRSGCSAVLRASLHRWPPP